MVGATPVKEERTAQAKASNAQEGETKLTPEESQWLKLTLTMVKAARRAKGGPQQWEHSEALDVRVEDRAMAGQSGDSPDGWLKLLGHLSGHLQGYPLQEIIETTTGMVGLLKAAKQPGPSGAAVVM